MTSTDQNQAPHEAAQHHKGAPSPADVERPTADAASAPAGEGDGRANIGVVGLAVMGSNLARNLASREGNTVAVFNRSADKTEHLVQAHPEAEFVPTYSYEEFAAALQKPRTALIMVKAGAPKKALNLTDAVIRHVAQGPRPVVFMLWGAHAQGKRAVIPPDRGHLVLCANHPSPLSALRPPVPFIGCGHFGQARMFRLQQEGGR
mgnify:CR=1 FL=1